MKVLMLGWELPPAISGGLGTACKGIADSLAEKNIDLTFVLPTENESISLNPKIKLISANNYIPAMEYLKEFDKIFQKKEKKTSTAKLWKNISPYCTSTEYAQKNTNNDYKENYEEEENNSILKFSGNYGINLIHEVMRYSSIGIALGFQESFDIIHAHDWLTFPNAICAKKISKKPLIVHIHSTEYDRSITCPNMKIVNMEKTGMEVADKIIAVSHYTKNMIVNKYGIEPDKIEVIHNAVNRKIQFSRYNIRKPFDEKLVLFLGRITEQKGPKYFLEAAAKVLNKMDNVRFVMSGNGNLFPDIITRVAELEIIDRFHFTGFLKGSDVERIYAMSDIYVMPSVSEPFGIAPFEAILYDIPVIISKQSGASEILKHALKVDFWDFDYLAETIISLLENDELRNNCINQCKDDMKNLTWSGAAEQIIKVYEKVNKKNF